MTRPHKDDYVQRRQQELEESRRRVEKLKAAAEEQGEAEHRDLLDRVEQGLQQVQQDLRNLAETTEEAFEDVKDGIERAWDDLMATLYNVSSKIRLP